ncbi:MAG: glycosyltransferase [Solirubrobacteraceae bacterium]
MELSAVQFLGFVEQPELARACAAADVLLFPSLQDEFGFVLLEGQAAGLACIASPFAGATEDLVVDHVSGLVVDPRDQAALAGALGALARDPGLCRSLGAVAHEASLDRTPRATAEGYLAAAIAAARS